MSPLHQRVEVSFPSFHRVHSQGVVAVRVLMVGATSSCAAHVWATWTEGVEVRALVPEPGRWRRHAMPGRSKTSRWGDLGGPQGLISAAVGVDASTLHRTSIHIAQTDIGVTMVEAAKAAGWATTSSPASCIPRFRTSQPRLQAPGRGSALGVGIDFVVLRQPSLCRPWRPGGPEVIRSAGWRFLFPPRKDLFRRLSRRGLGCGGTFVTDEFDNGTFELCAPGMFNRSEIAALMSDALELRVEAGELSLTFRPTWPGYLMVRGAPVEAHVSGCRRYRLPQREPSSFSAFFGRQPRTLEDIFHELAYGS